MEEVFAFLWELLVGFSFEATGERRFPRWLRVLAWVILFAICGGLTYGVLYGMGVKMIWALLMALMVCGLIYWGCTHRPEQGV